MKHYLLFKFCSVVALFITSSLFAQTSKFAIAIGGTAYDQGYSITQNQHGYYAIAGVTYSYIDTINGNMYAVKLDAEGNIKWAKSIGGDSSDVGYSIVKTNDNGFAIAGYTSSYGAGKYDVYVLKLDSMGTITWSKTIGGKGYDVGYSIIQTKDSGFAVTGYSHSFGDTLNDGVYVVKLDLAGNLLWTKVIGGAGSDIGNSIVQTTDGGYAIAGYSFSPNTGNQDMYVLKLDSAGNLKWAETIGGTGSDIANSIVQTIDGGYAIAGYTSSYGTGIDNVYVVKLDAAGKLKWSKTIGGKGTDKGNSILQTGNGDFIVAGTTTSFGTVTNNIYIIKLDSIGNLKWTKVIGQAGDNESNSIIQTADGGYAATGFTNYYGAGNYDMLVLKLDSAGNLCNLPDSGGAITSSDSGVVFQIGSVTSSDSGSVKKGGSGRSGGITNNICNLLNSVDVVLPTMPAVQLFPNPNNGKFTVTVMGITQAAKIEIYNILGEKIFSSYLNYNTCRLNLQNCTQSLYFYRVMNSDGSLETDGKLVIGR